MRLLATQYGITDVGFAKICRRLSVPRPGLGYWARIQHGQKPSRAPLPPSKQGVPDSATITPSAARVTSGESPAGPRPTPPMVLVADDLSSPRPAVRALRTALRGRKPYQGIVSLAGKGQTPIRVSPSSQDRALRILDGFFKGLEAREHSVSLRQEPGQHPVYSMEAVIAGINVEITIRERLAQTPHVPPKGETGMFAPAHDYAPSGELTLRVGGRYGDAHRSWTDRARKPLEGRLGEVVIGIEQVAKLQAEEERRREESRRQWEKERRDREIAQIRQQYERELAKDLVEMSSAWRQARDLRVFLAAVEEGVPEGIKTAEGFRAWIGWARDYAERRDPLRRPTEIAKRIEPEFLRCSVRGRST